MPNQEAIKVAVETVSDAAQAVSGAVDVKTVVAGSVGLSGIFLDIKELGAWFGEAIPGYLVLATLIYLCLGIRNRWREGKADKTDAK